MALRVLGTLTWGEQMKVARDRAGATLRGAAEAVSQVMPISYATLQRLESLDGVPDEPKRRAIAFCALLTYGFNPEDFGLSADDAPAALHFAEVRNLLIPADVAALGPTSVEPYACTPASGESREERAAA